MSGRDPEGVAVAAEVAALNGGAQGGGEDVDRLAGDGVRDVVELVPAPRRGELADGDDGKKVDEAAADPRTVTGVAAAGLVVKVTVEGGPGIVVDHQSTPEVAAEAAPATAPLSFAESVMAAHGDRTAAAKAQLERAKGRVEDRRTAVLETLVSRRREEAQANATGTPAAELWSGDDLTFVQDFVKLGTENGLSKTITLTRPVKPAVKPTPAAAPVQPTPLAAASGSRRSWSPARLLGGGSTPAPAPAPVEVKVVEQEPTTEVAFTLDVLCDLGWVMREEPASSPSGDVWTDLHSLPEYAYLCTDGEVRCVALSLSREGKFVLNQTNPAVRALPVNGQTGRPVPPARGRFDLPVAVDHILVPGDETPTEVRSALFIPSEQALRPYLVEQFTAKLQAQVEADLAATRAGLTKA